MAGKIAPLSQRLKRKAAEQAIDTSKLWVEPKSRYAIWCDASVLDPTSDRWAGFGIVRQHRGIWTGNSHAMGRGFEPWEAETQAVLQAMVYALGDKIVSRETPEDFETIVCYTDCRDVVQNIEFYRNTTSPDSYWGTEFLAKLRLLRDAGLKFECVKCESHQNLMTPNDHADAMAREGSEAALRHGRGACDCGSQQMDGCLRTSSRPLAVVNTSEE